MGDFNSKVGSDRDRWDLVIIGQRGYGSTNARGEKLQLQVLFNKQPMQY